MHGQLWVLRHSLQPLVSPEPSHRSINLRLMDITGSTNTAPFITLFVSFLKCLQNPPDRHKKTPTSIN